MNSAEDRIAIEDLRRLYAQATDQIGIGTPDQVAAGRATYHRIFTQDVDIRTSPGPNNLTAKGPDEWVDVVEGALGDYRATQHLIGTQLVELDGDSASMESYLSAWHQRPDGSVWVYLGTYIDQVRRTEAGWQIYDMELAQTIGYELPPQQLSSGVPE